MGKDGTIILWIIREKEGNENAGTSHIRPTKSTQALTVLTCIASVQTSLIPAQASQS